MFDELTISQYAHWMQLPDIPYLMHMYAFIRNLELRFIFVIWF